MMSWRRMQSQRKLLQFNQNGRLMSVLNPSCKLNLWHFSLHVIPFSLSLSPDFPVKLWAFLFKYRLKAKKKKEIHQRNSIPPRRDFSNSKPTDVNLTVVARRNIKSPESLESFLRALQTSSWSFTAIHPVAVMIFQGRKWPTDRPT